jgi:hypothetical protein
MAAQVYGECVWHESALRHLELFAELVRADERRRITNLMLYMHNKASPYHNYYKHAAVEINRKDGEGEKI